MQNESVSKIEWNHCSWGRVIAVTEVSVSGPSSVYIKYVCFFHVIYASLRSHLDLENILFKKLKWVGQNKNKYNNNNNNKKQPNEQTKQKQ